MKNHRTTTWDPTRAPTPTQGTPERALPSRLRAPTAGWLAAALVVALAPGCKSSDGGDVGANQSLQSCYELGGGRLQCVSTPGALHRDPVDVDHDGRADRFVCGNGTNGSRHHDDRAGDSGAREDDHRAGDAGAARTHDDDDGRDDDDDGVADHEDCDHMGCVAVDDHGEHGGDDHGGGDHGATYDHDHGGGGGGGYYADAGAGGGNRGGDDHGGGGGGYYADAGAGGSRGGDDHGGGDHGGGYYSDAGAGGSRGGDDHGGGGSYYKDAGASRPDSHGTMMMCRDGGVPATRPIPPSAPGGNVIP
jgi:uncharacterized membrane protein